MKILIWFSLVAFSCISTLIKAQNFEPANWHTHRSITELDSLELKYGLYYLLKDETFDFEYDTSGVLQCYTSLHEIIRVNNDEALSRSNRIYIPISGETELYELKARVIKPNGQIVDFDQNNLKTLEGEEGYKIFAIEGAELGGEIEYYYTLKVQPSNFTSRTIQLSYPIKAYNFSLSSPENLEYDFKVYNHPNQVIQVDTIKEKNIYKLEISDIPELYAEEFSSFENAKIRLELKLAYNTSNKKSRLFTWGDAGKRVYELVYSTSPLEKKEISRFLKAYKLKGDAINSFRKIEHDIKSTFSFEENAGESGEKIDMVVKNKYANSIGFTRLFAAILSELKIKHEIVMTSDRMTAEFDPSFDTWNYLDEYLIYLPGIKEFMSPKDTQLRLGTIPYNHQSAQGLFVGMELIQEFEHPVARIDIIPEEPYTANFDNMNIDVSFTKSLKENSVELTRSFKGYGADYYKTGLLLLQGDLKDNMLKDIIKYLALDAAIQELKVVNANTDYVSWHAPFTVKGNFTTSSYIEEAGDVILFRAGELIGLQSELYQDKTRILDVQNDFNRGYLREIKITIPDGYIVQNPEDLEMKEQVFDGERIIYNFNSSYSTNGSILSVSIEEYYNKLFYPKDQFEQFRKVINAAADWNKIVLVLSKN